MATFCSQRLENLYSSPHLSCPTQLDYQTSCLGMDKSFFKVPLWSRPRAIGQRANTSSTICGWPLGQQA